MSAPAECLPRFAPMRSEDLGEVLAIERRAYLHPWSHANFTDSLAAGYCAWTCRLHEELLGYAVMMLVLDEAHLLNLTVAPQWQRRGYGTLIMEHLFDVARSHGARNMFLEVRPSNAAALTLYAKLGFQVTGRRRGYYPAVGGREDAVLMALTL